MSRPAFFQPLHLPTCVSGLSYDGDNPPLIDLPEQKMEWRSFTGGASRWPLRLSPRRFPSCVFSSGRSRYPRGGYRNTGQSSHATGKNHITGNTGHRTTITSRRPKTHRGSSHENPSNESILCGEPGKDIVLVERQVDINSFQGSESESNERHDLEK